LRVLEIASVAGLISTDRSYICTIATRKFYLPPTHPGDLELLPPVSDTGGSMRLVFIFGDFSVPGETHTTQTTVGIQLYLGGSFPLGEIRGWAWTPLGLISVELPSL
jgi:hypothetical protein